jgi:hypothetical protein
MHGQIDVLLKKTLLLSLPDIAVDLLELSGNKRRIRPLSDTVGSYSP